MSSSDEAAGKGGCLAGMFERRMNDSKQMGFLLKGTIRRAGAVQAGMQSIRRAR
jgi:hypothetical protein